MFEFVGELLWFWVTAIIAIFLMFIVIFYISNDSYLCEIAPKVCEGK